MASEQLSTGLKIIQIQWSSDPAGDNAAIILDFSVNIDRTIKANRPDIILKDRKENTCLLTY